MLTGAWSLGPHRTVFNYSKGTHWIPSPLFSTPNGLGVLSNTDPQNRFSAHTSTISGD